MASEQAHCQAFQNIDRKCARKAGVGQPFEGVEPPTARKLMFSVRAREGSTR